VPTYLMSVYGDESRVRELMDQPEVMEAMFASVGAFNATLMEAGAWVFAGGLQFTDTAMVARPDGSTSSGPFLSPAEPMGGFWVIKASDDTAAQDWVRKASAACGSPVELRPFQADVDG
jgi:hypothetical protein